MNTKPIASIITITGQIYLRSDREPSEKTRTPFAAVLDIAAKMIAVLPVDKAIPCPDLVRSAIERVIASTSASPAKKLVKYNPFSPIYTSAALVTNNTRAKLIQI